jgi:hypothetical protein
VRKFFGLLLECPPEAAASRRVATALPDYLTRKSPAGWNILVVKKHSRIQTPISSKDPRVAQCLASECS